ncbi:MAG: glutamate--tRNA ligase [Phycisphaerales bacterium]|nr:glutamate--tRNA ligase [Phycisphaerales bacterium]
MTHNTSDDRPVVTRFAPSPTGHLHVGGARTALFCWAYAKRHSGQFILRIEDTDQARSSQESARGIMDDLAWLGITWDQGPTCILPDGSTCGGGDRGPYFQAQRLDIYNTYLQQLIAQGKAYPAFETPQELETQRKSAIAAKRNYRYDRAALDLPQHQLDQWLAEGREHVIRLKMPDEAITVHDAVRGVVTVQPEEMDDFIIRKRDGFPTYHFAVVVDDALMGVTHVLRGEEHLNNTPKHIALIRALGFDEPAYAHMSLTFNPDGSKMSKRDKDKAARTAAKAAGLAASPVAEIDDATFSAWLKDKKAQLEPDQLRALAVSLGIALPEVDVDDFRRAGYLPEVLCNFISLLGWSPGGNVEKFDMGFLADRFDFDRLIKTPSRFDRGKLLAFNLDALQAMSDDEFVRRVREHCERYHGDFIAHFDDASFDLFARSNHARSKTLEDPVASCRFFVVPDDEIEYERGKPVRKALVNGEPNGFAHLEAIAPLLEALPRWTVDAIEGVLSEYADAHADGKLGKTAQPLRVAVTGGVVSPAIGETLAILGQVSVLRRIRRLLALRETFTAG